MKQRKLHRWFTLIELIVAISIFGVIMVTVMSIFIFSSQMSTRVELNRAMQENIKNVVEDIAEELRKWSIEDVSPDNLHDCISGTPQIFSSPESGDKLCLAGNKKYILWHKVWGVWVRVTDVSQCSDFTENDESLCRILKSEGVSGTYYPLTNNLIAVESLKFTVSNETLPKLMIHMQLRPAYRKWLQSSIIDSNRMSIQTTVSQRFIKTQ